jgi:hypothetical protein
LNASPPLTVAEWREFLRGYSSEFLGSAFLRRADLDERRGSPLVSETQRETGWLGYEPASEAAVVAAEQRLGVRLPLTYRNFLLASNGFCHMAYSVDLLKAENIGWFGELFPDLLGAWSAPGLEYFAEHLRVLGRCLLVSDEAGGSGCYWLLSPDRATETGEWTAYQWWPGDGEDPEPFDNFAVLLASLWKAAAEYGP